MGIFLEEKIPMGTRKGLEIVRLPIPLKPQLPKLILYL